MAQHHGIFRYKMNMFEATALIVTSTIGAGVLGIPYAVSRIGLGLGILYIFLIGAVMIGMNLLVGEIVVRTKQRLHLPGLAHKYLGAPGRWLMSIVMYVMLFGILTVYMIGEGETLSILFGGDPQMWSIIFFLVGALFIIFGLRTIKAAEFVLGLGILVIVLLIAAFSAPFVEPHHLAHVDLAHLLLPYGVLLFAYHGATSLPEAHSLLEHKNHAFQQVIVASGFIIMAVYAVFTFMVVGVTGLATTEIATVGLGSAIGPSMVYFGNVFAALAMATSFLITGLALRDSLKWDLGFHHGFATAVTCCVPLFIYFFGVRNFIAAIDVIGGVFISIEMLLLLLIYWRAHQVADMPPGKYKIHHTMFIFVAVLIALIIGTIFSVGKFI